MEVSMKIRFLLLALYDKKFNGKFYEAEEFFIDHSISITKFEITEILSTLEGDGLIKLMSVNDTVFTQISLDGIEFVEENNFFNESSYLPQDRLKPLDREILRNKLDDFFILINKSKLGTCLSAEAVEKEITELKTLLNILGRKSWLQILKGKFLDLAKDEISDEEMNSMLDIFDEKHLHLLEGAN